MAAQADSTEVSQLRASDVIVYDNGGATPPRYNDCANCKKSCIFGKEPAQQKALAERKCCVCGNIASKRCGMCGDSDYCSQKCQRLDWEKHKDNCISRDNEDLATQIPIDIDIRGLAKLLNQDPKILSSKKFLARVRKNTPSCDCSICRSCCSSIPGAFDPYHLWKLIKSGHIRLEDLIKDYYLGLDNEVFWYLRPKKIDEKSISLAPIDCKRGACVHLGDNGCTLPPEFLPLGCRSALPCMDQFEPALLCMDQFEPELSEPIKRELSVPIDKPHVPVVWDNEAGRKLIRLFDKTMSEKYPDARIDEAEVIRQLHEEAIKQKDRKEKMMQEFYEMMRGLKK